MTHQYSEIVGEKPIRVLRCTSSTRPGAPRVGDQIYETDTGNTLIFQSATTGWTPPWNTKWGKVTEVVCTAGTAGAAVGASFGKYISALSLTWTAVGNRRYKYSINTLWSSASRLQAAFVTTGGSFAGSNPQLHAPNASANVSEDFITSFETGISAGSVTREVWIKCLDGGTGTFYADANFNMVFTIEDDGPNGVPL